MTFKQWLTALDAAVQNKIGVSIHDLPDMPFRDWYDAKYTIAEAVEEVLENQNLEDEFGDFGDECEDFED